jgi:hypothetical protein
MDGIAIAVVISVPETHRRDEMVVTPALEVQELKTHEAAALKLDGLLQLRRMLLLLQLPPQERLVIGNVTVHHPRP